MHKIYLGLGSNLGNRKENLAYAIRFIGERVGKVLRVSSFIETEPWGFESENTFVNAVILCETDLTPRQLLGATQKIEREMGRQKKSTDGGYSVIVHRHHPSYTPVIAVAYCNQPANIAKVAVRAYISDTWGAWAFLAYQ